MSLRPRITIRGLLVLTAICGIGFAYARFAIHCAWELTPHVAMEEKLTPTQLQARARPERAAILINFAVFPVIVIVVIGLCAILVRFLVRFFNTDLTPAEP